MLPFVKPYFFQYFSTLLNVHSLFNWKFNIECYLIKEFKKIKILIYIYIYMWVTYVILFFTISHEGMFIDVWERERERERERETFIWGKHPLVASHTHPKWGSHRKPRLCVLTSDWNHNRFGVWDDAPSNWATGQGNLFHSYNYNQSTCRVVKDTEVPEGKDHTNTWFLITSPGSYTWLVVQYLPSLLWTRRLHSRLPQRIKAKFMRVTHTVCPPFLWPTTSLSSHITSHISLFFLPQTQQPPYYSSNTKAHSFRPLCTSFQPDWDGFSLDVC